MPQITAGILIQLAYNVFYFLVSKAVSATGNPQFIANFERVCSDIEIMFKDLK